MTYWSAPGDSKPPFKDAVKNLEKGGKELKKGHVFIPSWSNHWVKVDITLPKELKGVDEDIICEPCSYVLVKDPGSVLTHQSSLTRRPKASSSLSTRRLYTLSQVDLIPPKMVFQGGKRTVESSMSSPKKQSRRGHTRLSSRCRVMACLASGWTDTGIKSQT